MRRKRTSMNYYMLRNINRKKYVNYDDLMSTKLAKVLGVSGGLLIVVSLFVQHIGFFMVGVFCLIVAFLAITFG